MPVKDAPTHELGAPGLRSDPRSGWYDTWEQTPECVWPTSTRVYDQVRKAAHVASGLRAISLPIRRTRWFLEPDLEVRPEVYELVRTDLGLEDAGRRRRRRQGIVWGEFLRHILLMLPFGHMVFEQLYELAQEDGRTVAHLRKLGPRMPRTITGWKVAGDGGLDGIVQTVPDGNGFWRDQFIPIDRLVVFSHEREGADWTGQSVLRPVYPHWLINQGLMRIDAMAGERNGMGIPWVEFDESAGGDKNTALDIAKKLRAGEEAGAATASGAYRISILGVTGSIRDILASIRYHDQEAGRALLTMFLDLGHDNGARSLGDTFADFFAEAEQALADEIADTVTEHVIRDLVEWNFGPDEPYPLLRCDEITADSAPTAEAMKQLADAGFVVPDDGLEVQLRRRYGWAIPPGLENGAGFRPPIETVIPPASPEDDDDPAAAALSASSLEQLEARLARLRAGGPRLPSRR